MPEAEESVLPTLKSMPRLRLWPAVFIVAAHWTGTLAVLTLGSTNVDSIIALGAIPLAAACLLAIWWCFASRATILDRVLGLPLALGAIVLPVTLEKTHPELMLALTVPAVTSGGVVVLLLSCRASRGVQRVLAVLFLLGCTGLCSMLRADSYGTNFLPSLSWRWSPTETERTGALSRSDAQGTAQLPAQAGPQDSPDFRGANRDAVLSGVRFSTDWTTPPREVWRVTVGSAWSSFSAVGDYLFTQEQYGGDELVTCRSAATGEVVWSQAHAARFSDDVGLGPRATPVFYEGRLYTQGGTGLLQCLEAATGAVVWQRDLTKDAPARVPGYGFSGTPLVRGEYVVAYACGGAEEGKNVVAFRRDTGEPVWRGGHRGSGYSSPQWARIGGVDQILVVNNFGVESLRLDTGASLWENAWAVKEYPRCVQPSVTEDGRVLYGATGNVGARMVRVTATGDAWTVAELWTTKRFRPYFNDGVLHKGFYYGFDGNRLSCIDLETGARRWDGKHYGGQLLLVSDLELLLVLDEKGNVVLVRATPDRFEEIARFKVLNGKSWAYPTLAQGRLFVRNEEEAACYELP